MARNTAQKLAEAQDRVARLRHELSAEKRRADAHRKITLGGLVIAAGADNLDAAVITAALARCVAVVERSPEQAESLRQQGIAILEARRKSK